jgi:AraC-like DNA-binding protein
MSAPHATIGRMDKLRQLRLAKDAMDRDWADPELDLDAVAAHAGYSRYHFLRAFKQVYGETPGQYLTHRRIERAEDLLRTADLRHRDLPPGRFHRPGHLLGQDTPCDDRSGSIGKLPVFVGACSGSHSTATAPSAGMCSGAPAGRTLRKVSRAPRTRA